jgi:hypothetical protein
MQINEENYKFKIIRANCGISLPGAWDDIMVERQACPVAKKVCCGRRKHTVTVDCGASPRPRCPASQFPVMELPTTLQKQDVVTSHLLTTRNSCVLQYHTKLHSRYSKRIAILTQVVILTNKQTDFSLRPGFAFCARQATHHLLHIRYFDVLDCTGCTGAPWAEHLRDVKILFTNECSLY